jgi:hypothetical protein
VLLPAQDQLLVKSDKGSTGFKGVHQHKGRYQAQCRTTPCRNNHLGTFGISHEAAQAYLQHWETDHADALAKDRRQGLAPPPVLRDIDEDLLVHSSKSSSGFKGVRLHHGRYQATCQTAPCTKNNLGTFDTPEEAAQAYLQHWETDHADALAKERQQGPPAPTSAP